MLICDGFNGNEYYKEIENEHLLAIRRVEHLKKIGPCLFLFGCFLFIILYIRYGNFDDGLASMLFAILFMLVGLVLRWLAYEIHKAQGLNIAQKKLKDGAVKVYVEKDLSFIITANEEQVIRITQVQQFFHDNDTYTLHIKGRMGNENLATSTYILSMDIHHRDLLESYLALSINQLHYPNFRNDVLKKVMHMNTDNRNDIFLDMLKGSQFLLVCSLDKKAMGYQVNFVHNITLTTASREQKILVFTSLDEIDDELRKQYLILLVCSLEEIVTSYDECMHMIETNVFQEPTIASMNGCIINYNQECLSLDLAPLKTYLLKI